MRIKQLSNRKVRDFVVTLRARKVSGAFDKRPPGPRTGFAVFLAANVTRNMIGAAAND